MCGGESITSQWSQGTKGVQFGVLMVPSLLAVGRFGSVSKISSFI